MRKGTPRSTRNSAASAAQRQPSSAASRIRSGPGLEGLDQSREGRDAGGRGVARVEDQVLVLLEVAVVREGQALLHHEEGDEVAVGAARLAPDELGGVGVALLRHHRGAGGAGLVDRDEGEFGRGPEDDLLAVTREVHEQGRRRRGELDAGVAVGHGVHGIARGPREAEGGGSPLAVDRQARPGQGAGAQRALVGARVRVLEAAVVALERRAPGEQVVGEGDRLRPLHVRVAGHEGAGVLRRELAQRVERVEEGASSLAARPCAARAGGRGRPGRCGCGPRGGCGRRRPCATVSSASTKECMSSAVGSTTRLPSSAPTARAARPRPSSSAVTLAGRMPALPQHRRVGDRALEVLGQEALVDRGRREERVYRRIEPGAATRAGLEVSQSFAMASVPRGGDVAALAGLRALGQGRAVGLDPRLEPARAPWWAGRRG